MHLLGTSVLTLIILPLAFSCDHNSARTLGDYNNIIRIDLKHAEASIEQLNPNCTSRNAGMSPTLKSTNTPQTIRKKICRVNNKLKKFGTENLNGQVKDVLNKLVGIDESLSCRCLRKDEQTVRPTPKMRKWKLCRVKDTLSILLTLFEQYNAYQSSRPERPENENITEQTGV